MRWFYTVVVRTVCWFRQGWTDIAGTYRAKTDKNTLFFKLTSQFSELLSCSNTGLDWFQSWNTRNYIWRDALLYLAMESYWMTRKMQESMAFFTLIIHKECNGNWHCTMLQGLYRDAGKCYSALLISWRNVEEYSEALMKNRGKQPGIIVHP